MKFWSKGLGRRCLEIDCGSETPAVEGDQLALSGVVRPPLAWAYTITMDAEDWVAFMGLTLRPAVVAHLARRARWGLALRAAWHMNLFLIGLALALSGAWLGRRRR